MHEFCATGFWCDHRSSYKLIPNPFLFLHEAILASKCGGFQFPCDSENRRSAGTRSSVEYPVQTSSCIGTASRLTCIFPTQTCAAAAATPKRETHLSSVLDGCESILECSQRLETDSQSPQNNQRAKKVILAPPEGGYVWLDQADNELKLADVQIKVPTQFETFAGNRWRAVTWDTPIPVASGRALLLRAQGVTLMENWDMMQAFTQDL
ncbi:hypothetical protein K438DRAFT_1786689 [Mycena galopus ATCC 62051]|nr:hypothetical protein K438DRAFT_1786689 [Mycena galopus ATCC 62051]